MSKTLPLVAYIYIVFLGLFHTLLLMSIKLHFSYFRTCPKANIPISWTDLGIATIGKMQLAKQSSPILMSPSGSSNFSTTLMPRIKSETNPFTPLGIIRVRMDLCVVYVNCH